MTANELTRLFSDRTVSGEEKSAVALRYLNAFTRGEGNIKIPDTAVRAACAQQILSGNDSSGLNGDLPTAGKLNRFSTNTVEFSNLPDILKGVGRFLKESPAGTSADFLEDDFNLDFETIDPNFHVDYTGKYTYVPNSLLPDYLVAERAYHHRLARFYFENIAKLPGRSARMKGLSVPYLELDSMELKEINLSNSILYGADFKDCRFDATFFLDADLQKSTFTNCRFDHVNLMGCYCEGVEFDRCTFLHGSFFGANLETARFKNCRFVEVEFSSTDFETTSTAGCEFDKCNMSLTNLNGMSELNQIQLEKLYGDQSTRLPQHLNPPEFWPETADSATWRHWVKTGETIESKACLIYE